MKPRTAILWGALLGATGVAAGAIGSHLLEERLPPRQFDQFQIAVRYQMYHATALVLVGLLGRQGGSRWLTVSAWALLGGVILFCGGLYGYVAAVTVPLPLRFLVAPVPLGGLLMICGWLALAAHAWRDRQGQREI